MDDHLFLLEDLTGWELVLASYQYTNSESHTASDSQESIAITDVESVVPDGDEVTDQSAGSKSIDWMPRTLDILGLDENLLSKIHGRLVAAGLLDMDVLDRQAGLCYRLTREGKKVLKTCLLTANFAHNPSQMNDDQSETADSDEYKMSA